MASIQIEGCDEGNSARVHRSQSVVLDAAVPQTFHRIHKNQVQVDFNRGRAVLYRILERFLDRFSDLLLRVDGRAWQGVPRRGLGLEGEP